MGPAGILSSLYFVFMSPPKLQLASPAICKHIYPAPDGELTGSPGLWPSECILPAAWGPVLLRWVCGVFVHGGWLRPSARVMGVIPTLGSRFSTRRSIKVKTEAGWINTENSEHLEEEAIERRGSRSPRNLSPSSRCTARALAWLCPPSDLGDHGRVTPHHWPPLLRCETRGPHQGGLTVTHSPRCKRPQLLSNLKHYLCILRVWNQGLYPKTLRRLHIFRTGITMFFKTLP